MGYYIVATFDGDDVKLRQPKEASSPEDAVYARGVVPEDFEKIRVFPVKEDAVGDCMFWDKESLDL